MKQLLKIAGLALALTLGSAGALVAQDKDKAAAADKFDLPPFPTDASVKQSMSLEIGRAHV